MRTKSISRFRRKGLAPLALFKLTSLESGQQPHQYRQVCTSTLKRMAVLITNTKKAVSMIRGLCAGVEILTRRRICPP